MGKIHRNQSGFSAVEGILVLVIVALVAVVGFMVYNNHSKTTSASTTKPSTSTKTKTAQAPDPYTGWQSYCDTRSKACFKYPQGWNLEYGASINTQLNSPDAQLAKFSDSDQKYPTGQYGVQLHLGGTDSAYGTSTTSSFYTTTIDDVSGQAGLKVVGGYVPSVNIASYSIVDTAFIKAHSLAVGKTSQDVPNLSYTNPTTSTSYAFFANDASLSGAGTTKNVTDWFKTDYAKQALLILESYKQQ